MTIDVRKLAEEAGIKDGVDATILSSGKFKYISWNVREEQLVAFANLVLECAAIEAEKFSVGPMERAQAQTAIQTACAIRALKVKP